MDDRQVYTHATSVGNLEKILESGGKIAPLRTIANKNPNVQVSVEPLPIPVRFTMPAKDAYQRMNGIKNTDRVSLSKDGYVPNYGEVVIVKRLSPKVIKPGERLNSIPKEFTTGRSLSLRSNAYVYVPDEQYDVLKKKYGNIRFKKRSTLKLNEYGFRDRVSAFVEKLFNKNAEVKSDAWYRRRFGRNARLVGSEALGINVPGKSDIDIFVPYKNEKYFRKAVDRFAAKYPNLNLNKASLLRDNKKTFSGRLGNDDIDVVLAYGEKARRFADAFNAAKTRITKEKLDEIVKNKVQLKNAFFFPRYRYKRYKNQVAEELGLKQNYF